MHRFEVTSDDLNNLNEFFDKHEIHIHLRPALVKIVREAIEITEQMKKIQLTDQEAEMITERHKMMRRIRCNSADKVLLA